MSSAISLIAELAFSLLVRTQDLAASPRTADRQPLC
jgi:hypothetical protein